jgi:hypothetical protein
MQGDNSRGEKSRKTGRDFDRLTARLGGVTSDGASKSMLSVSPSRLLSLPPSINITIAYDRFSKHALFPRHILYQV